MSETVLITGITSFLGAHVALTFLKNDWTVHGTLRSPTKQSDVESSPFFAEYIDSGKLKLFVTGPLESGNYDEAIKGCSAVVHVASPVEFEGTDFRKDYLVPAEQGTRYVLERAIQEAGVKNIVMTSTYGSVGQHRTPPTEQVGQVITEDHWNPYTLEELDEMSRTHVNPNKTFPEGYLFYMGAKKYAELAAWDLVKEAKQSGKDVTLATMNCALILGPPIQPMTSLSKGGMSTEVLYVHMAAGQDFTPLNLPFPYMVDVRDAAEAHYQAIVRGAEGRFNLSSCPYSFQQVVDFLRETYPHELHRIAVGTPGKYDWKDPGVYTLDASKSERELGLKYRTFQETMKDAFDRFLQLEKEGLK